MRTMHIALFAAAFCAPFLSQAQWSLTGNAGTNPSINFLGTTDAQPLVFKVNGARAGLIDYDDLKANTAFGHGALFAITTGTRNNAFGFNALKNNTTGSYNTASGYFALVNNTGGNSNNAIGYQSLCLNTNGYSNIALGYRALYYNGTGHSNIGIGTGALYYNASSSNHIAIGDSALRNQTSNSDNVAIGFKALYTSSTGKYNIALGTQALYNNTSGGYSIASGYQSLYNNNTGNFNTASGYQAMYNNTSGTSNVAVGGFAMMYNTTGSFNTAVGTGANTSNTTSGYNTALGAYSGISYGSTITNTTAVGYDAGTTASNQVRVGNASVTSIGGQVGWTNLSDERVKKDIKENVPGLEFINALRPVTYHFDLMKENTLMNRKNDTTVWEGKNDIEKINFTGLLAQEVDAAAKKLGYDFSGVDKSGNMLGLRYADFVTPLIKAVQQLSKMNNEKDAVILQQQQQLSDMMQRLNAIEKQLAITNTLPVNAQGITSAILGQNAPNPFYNTTTIRYTLPSNTTNAHLIITNMSGKVVKEIPLNGSGAGHVIISAAGALSTGTYNYTLFVQGNMVESRQMLLLK
jgi:trimeric autotransporter adhesin